MDKKQKRERIQKRIAREFKDGDYVNLGIGLPTGVADFIPDEVTIHFQSENGIMGVGPKPPAGEEIPDLINAGGGPITAKDGASFFDSVTSFSIIRGGHIDFTVLGTLQVDARGNVANWSIPGKIVPGMGGAMDLVSGAKQVIIATLHLDKYGKSKIMKECTLPLTGKGVVNLIVTDMAVIKVVEDGLKLIDIAEDTTIEKVVEATEPQLIIPDKVGIFS
ncbi:MAG: 3-oxoacid CoA-transferase subunit B [Myxococcota bacterium]